MATLTKGYTFGSTELVTSAKLSGLIDDGTVTAIVNADIDAAAGIVGSKLNLAAPGVIGGTTPAAITGTTVTATTNFVGDITGDVTGTADIATNIAGGAGGSIPYQSAANTTALLANGTDGQILTSNGTTVAPSWEDAGAASVPAGIILPYGGAAAPDGYLLCDGSTVSQTTYAALYAVVGHSFGADPGGGDFILPDMIGRVPLGFDVGDVRLTNADSIGASGGAENGVAAHTHKVSQVTGGSGNTGPDNTASSTNFAECTALDSSSTGTADGNLQPYLAVNYIIKT